MGCHECFDDGPHIKFSHFEIDISPLTFISFIFYVGAIIGIISLLKASWKNARRDSAESTGIVARNIIAGLILNSLSLIVNVVIIHAVHNLRRFVPWQFDLYFLIIYFSDFLCIVAWALLYSGIRGILKASTSAVFFLLAGFTVFLYSLRELGHQIRIFGTVLNIIGISYPFLIVGLLVFFYFFKARPRKMDQKGTFALIFFFWFSVIVPMFTGNFYYPLGQLYDGLIFTWVISTLLFSLLFTLLNVDTEKKVSGRELGWLLLAVMITGVGTFASMLPVTLMTR